MTRPGPLRLAVLTVAALSAVWALVSPLGSVPDEPAHVIYAGAVVRGELGSGPLGRDVRVPADVASAGGTTCTAFKPDVTADCRSDLENSRSPTGTVTGAGRYPPLYYAVVGLPTLIDFGPAAWYAMRLLSVLLGLALLWVATTAWSRDPLPVAAGLLLAGTPMVAFLLGSVNPNGVEIVAGVAVVLAGAGLLDTLRSGAAVSAARTSSLLVPVAYLALARPSSYVLAFALLGVLALAGTTVLMAPARRARSAVLAGATLGALLLGLLSARLIALPPLEVVAPDVVGVSLTQAAATTRALADDWLLETVGLFGWRDHQPPDLLRVSWLVLVAAVVVVAVVVGSWWDRTALAVLVVGAALVAPFFVFVTLFRDGAGYQGRYAMALTQGVVILAAAVCARSRVSGHAAWRAVPGLALVLGLAALAGSYLRYGVGLPLPGPVAAVRGLVWVPPAWPLVVLLLAVAGWTTALLSRPTGSRDRPCERGSMAG